MVSLLVRGSEAEVSIAVRRFLELNGLDPAAPDGRGLFNEVYNSAYAARVLIR